MAEVSKIIKLWGEGKSVGLNIKLSSEDMGIQPKDAASAVEAIDKLQFLAEICACRELVRQGKLSIDQMNAAIQDYSQKAKALKEATK